MLAGLPYWRISCSYFLYFAVLGVLLPFWPLYLYLERGFDLRHVGFLAAIMSATKIIMPNVSAWLVDYKSCNRIFLLRCAGLGAALCFAMVPFAATPLVMGFIVFLFASFLTSSLPQLEAMTMGLLGDMRHEYTRIRVWGSIGFTVAVLAFGAWLQHTSLLLAVPWAVAAIMFMFAVNNMLLPAGTAEHKAKDTAGDSNSGGNILQVLRNPGIVSFLVACCLLQLSHGPYYTYFSIYLNDHGYSTRAISNLWITGVLAEIILYTVIHKLLLRFGAHRLLLAATLAAVARWLLLPFFADNIVALVLVQALHAMTFGTFHAAAIQCVHDGFPPALRARGQALYASTSFGLGLALGHAAAALMWQQAGATTTFVFASAVSLVAAIILWWRVPRSFSAIIAK